MAIAQHERGYSYIRRQIIILGLFRFSESFAWTTIFPYAFFMMQSFLPASSTRDANAAAYASATVALFTFGEFLTSVAWAKVSDRIGRKPTLMIGVVGGCASALMFGFSGSLAMALIARAVGGLVNPNVGVVSACVGELVLRKEDQGKAFSIVPFLRGLGSLVGPVVGGYLADPVTTWPSAFHNDSIWKTYPYLLPNIVVFLVMASTGVLGLLCLQETHPKFHNTERATWRGILNCMCRNIKRISMHAETATYTALPSSGDSIPLDERGDLEDARPEQSGHVAPVSPDPENTNQTSTPWTSQVILQILAVSILAFHKVSSDVIIPIFLATNKASSTGASGATESGIKSMSGFGMSPPSISNVLLSQAIVAILIQTIIVPRIINSWGPLKSFRCAVVIFPWIYCFTPFTARFPTPFSLMAILLDLWIKLLLVNTGYIASAILITNTSPSPIHLATINGATAALGGLSRSIGSAISGSLFQAGLKSSDIGLPFWVLGGVAGVGALVSWLLRDEP